MTRFIVIAACAAAVVCSGCKSNKPSGSVINGKTTNIETFTVAQATFYEYITLPVIVNPFREASLGLMSGGRVTKLYADKGDRVAEGKVLLETETEILRASLDLAKANLDFQKSEFDRNRQLFDAGSISQAVFDAAKLASAQAQSQFDIARKQYDDATLEAPFAGVITQRNIEVGEVLGPGAQAFRIIDIDRVKVRAGIPEKYIGDFRKDNLVSILFDAIPQKVFKGRITYISPEANTTVRTFESEIIVDNRGGIIRAGIMGNAKIQRRTFPNALLIPLDSLIETQIGRKIFVVKDDTLAAERSITIDGGNEDMIVVTSGIEAGERVVTKGQYDLVNGERVKITGEYKKAASEEEGSAK